MGKLSFSGFVEGRIVHHDKLINWQDTDGLGGAPGTGLLQYGNNYFRVTDAQRGTRVTLSNATAIVGVKSSEGFFANAQFTVDDSQTAGGTVKLPQAEVGHHFELSDHWKWTTRIGLLVPSLSNENINPGWSTAYTLTPSSFNTWIGEEAQVAAFENMLTHTMARSTYWLRFAIFSSGDTMGSLLRGRGFAQHSYIGAQGTKWPVAGVIGGGAQGVTDRQEINGDLGMYANLGYEWDSKYAVNVWYWQNDGDNRTQNGGVALAGDPDLDTEWSWKTNFKTIDFRISPVSIIDIIGQYTIGETKRGGPNAANALEADFTTLFALVRYNQKKHHLSYRYETFEITDPQSNDGLLQKGIAHTTAYIYDVSFNQRLGLEWISRSTEKIDGATLAETGATQPEEIGQLFYRVYY